jgi:hypothetical protein
VAFNVVPDLLRGIALRRRRWDLFQIPPRIGPAHRRDRRPPMHLTAVPEEEDRTTQRPPQRSEDLGHGDGLNVVRLPAEVEAQVLTRGGYREGGQSGEAILLVVVGHERCVPLGRPGPATRGDAQQATLIAAGEMGAKSSGLF